MSHDRDFLQGLTKTVYEFKDHVIREYIGDIDYYLDERNVENLREVEKRDVVKELPKENKKQSYEEQKKIKGLHNKLSKVESNINKLERDIKAIDVELETNYDATVAKANFFEDYQKKKDTLNSYMEQWELVQEEIDSLS